MPVKGKNGPAHTYNRQQSEATKNTEIDHEGFQQVRNKKSTMRNIFEGGNMNQGLDKGKSGREVTNQQVDTTEQAAPNRGAAPAAALHSLRGE